MSLPFLPSVPRPRSHSALHALLPALLLLAAGPAAPAGRPPNPGPEPVDAGLYRACIDLLRNALDSNQFWPSMHAAQALTEAGFTALVRYRLTPRLPRETDPNRRCGIARELVRAGETDKTAVLAAVLAGRNSTMDQRVHAAESIYKVNAAAQTAAALRRALDAGNPSLELMAAAALVRAGNSEFMPRIRARLVPGNPKVFRTAAWLAGRFRDPAARPLLQRLAAVKCDPLSHSFVLNALAKLGDPSARRRVLENLGNANAAVRTYAAATLGTYAGPKTLPRLRALLADPNLDARIRAAQAALRIIHRQLAPDRDRDGLPDAVEFELGTPETRAEPLIQIWKDQPRPIPANIDPETRAPHPVEIRFCHTGAHRFLWAVRFDRPLSDQRTVFHLYMDLDDNRATGRQDSPWARGVDVMDSFIDARLQPRWFTPGLRTHPDWPTRALVIGPDLWLCDDLRIHSKNGKTHFRMWTLGECRNAAGKVISHFNTPAQVVRAPLHPGRTVPRPPILESEGARRFPPSWALRHALETDPRTTALDLRTARRRNVEILGNGAADLPGTGAGALRFTIPLSAPRYLAAYMRAAGADPGAIDVIRSGARLARFAATEVEDPGDLLVTEKPIAFHKGDILELRAAPRSGPVRLRQVFLLPAMPKWPALRIERPTSAVLPPAPQRPTDRVILAWSTNRPAICTITAALPSSGKSVRKTVDRAPVEVHRFVIPDSWPRTRTPLRITIHARDQFGETAQTHPVPVPLHRPRPAGSSSWPSRRIPLTLFGPAQATGTPEPVRTGVPFPPRTLADPSHCRVLDSRGRPRPAQFQALAYWPDGSVKWLLVDFLTRPAPAAASLRYTLVAGVPPAPLPGAPRVRVRQTPTAILVDTGPLRLRFSRDRFTPFESVQTGRRTTPPAAKDENQAAGIIVVDGKGTLRSSQYARPDEMLVETAGPVRATLCVRGRLAAPGGDRPGPAYLCRLDFFAGLRRVRCTVSLDNDILAPTMSRFRSAQLRIPLLQPAETAVFGGDGNAPIPVRTLPARLLQDYDNRWRLVARSNPRPRAAGKRAPGWVAAGGVAVRVPYFWQLYPKALAVSQNWISIGLLPRLPENQYADPEDRKLFDRLYFWCDKGDYRLRCGVRITTVALVDFNGRPDNAPPSPGNAAPCPRFAACPAAWYCASQVMGPLVPRRPGCFPRYEANLDSAFKRFLKRRETFREYGFMNFGDWYGERRWNWGNIEYDTQGALALNFLRTGRPDLLERARQAEAHNADIDTIHYDPNPENVGRVHVHCLGHTGGYFPQGYKGMARAFTRGAMTPSHTWDRGHFLLWALTGEPRFRETGDLAARRLAAVDANKSGIGRSRSGGWALIALTAAYQVAGNPEYLTAARVLTRKILHKQRPNGQWRYPIWEARKQKPQPWGCKPFMTGIILHGLCMMDRIAPSPRIETAIRRGAEYLWSNTYIPKDHGFLYAEAPGFNRHGGIWTLPLVGDGLAYACRLDPKHRDESRLIEACSWNFYRAGISDFGKSFTQAICFMPYMLPQLLELGISKIPAPIEPDILQVRRAIVLPPGARCELRIWTRRSAKGAAEWTAAFADPAGPWLTLPPGHTLHWRAGPGLSSSPAVPVHAPPRPDRRQVHITLRSGNRTEHVIIRLEAVAPRAPGARIGWITGKDDLLRRAVTACGGKIEPIPDLRSADLARFHTLVAGDEAFEKNYAHCREAYRKLLEFVAAGGRLVCGQLNDAHWRLEFLPFDLVLSDANSATGAIVAPDHPLFSRPARIQRMPPVACYDTVIAAPQWRVLMQDAGGRPAVVEAALGRGRVLVLMPSFDRPLVGGQSPAAVRRACRALIRNWIAYIGR